MYEHRWADGTKYKLYSIGHPNLEYDEVRLSVSASSCSPPCICDGFKICLHRHHGGSRTPIWPAVTVKDRKSALRTAAKMRSWARTLEDAQIRSLPCQEGAAEWARRNGFTEHRAPSLCSRKARIGRRSSTETAKL